MQKLLTATCLIGLLSSTTISNWVLAQTTPPPKPAAKTKPCTSPAYRQFEFWLGEWKVLNLNSG